MNTVQDALIRFFGAWGGATLEFPAVWIVFWTWTGMCVGSFLNVCVWRIPNGMSIVSPPSHCPKCGHEIPFYENIPLFSWLFLRARCSACHDRISARYPIVECLTGAVFLWLFLRFRSAWPGMPPDAIPLLLLQLTLGAVLIAAAFTDCDWRIIPDGFVITLAAALVLCQSLRAILLGPDAVCSLPVWGKLLGLPLAEIIFAGLFFAGFAMLGRAVFRRDAFGWGDVKLLAVLAGVLHLYGLLSALLFASLSAILFAPLLHKIKPGTRRRGIPFAPFIALGTGVWLMFGKTLTRMFFQLAAH